MERKISELKSSKGLDVLVSLTPHVKALASVESLVGLFEELRNADDETKAQNGYAANILEKLVMSWLRDCRGELFEIIKILDGVSDEDIEDMGAFAVFARITELFKDPEFMGFFRSFVVTPRGM